MFFIGDFISGYIVVDNYIKRKVKEDVSFITKIKVTITYMDVRFLTRDPVRRALYKHNIKKIM